MPNGTPSSKVQRIVGLMVDTADDNEAMQDDFKEEDGIKAVHEAFRLGINFFDTSPLYGKTKSETVRKFKLLCTMCCRHTI